MTATSSEPVSAAELAALREVAAAARVLVTRIAEVGTPSRTDPTVVRLGQAVGALR